MEPKDCSAAQHEFVFANQPEISAGLVEKLLKFDRSVGNLAAQV